MRSSLLALLLIGLSAHADFKAPKPIEGLYGPEFTFTFNGSVSDEKRQEYIKQVRAHLVDGQPPLAKFKSVDLSSQPTFTSPNDWWFKIGTNPGVAEISMSPLTLKQLKQYKEDIQSAIFVNAAIVGLFPWDYLGGGHLNFSTRIFGNSIMLARNFIVDFWNHNELAMGILSYDTNNAVPFALFGEKGLSELEHCLARAAAGEWPDTENGLKEFLAEVKRIQGLHADQVGHTSRGKYHDLNFHNGRIEIRSVRPQKNMDEWVNQVELIESRINNHLRFIEDPLPLKLKTPFIPKPDFGEHGTSHRYIPPIDPQAALKAFHQYVGESRLEWVNHRSYIWPPWVAAGELQKFEQSGYFKQKEFVFSVKRRARACAEALKP